MSAMTDAQSVHLVTTLVRKSNFDALKDMFCVCQFNVGSRSTVINHAVLTAAIRTDNLEICKWIVIEHKITLDDMRGCWWSIGHALRAEQFDTVAWLIDRFSITPVDEPDPEADDDWKSLNSVDVDADMPPAPQLIDDLIGHIQRMNSEGTLSVTTLRQVELILLTARMLSATRA